MRILMLTHSFNCLSQRLFVELERLGHEVSVEFDVNDAVTREAMDLHRPNLLVAPFLKRAIPEDVWRRLPCIILHPGVRGDRGPSALDWAVLEGESLWGVTALQAEAEMDAGPVWASVEFPMRAARKSSLYRNEVTEAAVEALLLTLERMASGSFEPRRIEAGALDVRGRLRPAMTQADRDVHWERDDTATVLRKIRSADGQPGLLDELHGKRVYLYGAWPEDRLTGKPGALIARRHGAVCRATRDGAVWLSHLREHPEGGEPTCKLPAVQVLGEAVLALPESLIALDAPDDHRTFRDLRYEERGAVGYLHFDFYNGAMGTDDCRRLLSAYRFAQERATHVIVLMGGPDFWSNGLDLNRIEAADSPADASWANINAMDDLARAIITDERHVTVAALQGNAGAGGVFLALAADHVVARDGIVLNPHYKSMGNLYGSEYWTYLLPRRVGAGRAAALVASRLPMGAPEAREAGLIDAHFGSDVADFRRYLGRYAEHLAGTGLPLRLAAKRQRRAADERAKPLERYRDEELERMNLNFYGFDPSYHVARYHFVFKVPHSRTPYYLARHRVDERGARRA